MPIALILIDALAPAYVRRSMLPTVCDLGQGGYDGPLINLYAYRGIEATLFSGLLPSQHGIWTEFKPAARTADRGGVWKQVAHWMIRASDLIPSDRLRLDIRYAVLSPHRQPGAFPPMGNLIPTELIGAFTRSLDAPIWNLGSLYPHRTLFDELHAAEMPFEIVMHPIIRYDQQVVEHVRSRLARGPRPEFWYIKFAALDWIGHQYGPDVTRLAPALRKLNEQLAALFSTLRSAYPGSEVDIVVVSDHGMSRVTQTIDVQPALAESGLVLGRDFIHFIDSTMFRCWSEDPRVCNMLATLLADVAGARVLDRVARHTLHIPTGIACGDVLVALDEGLAFFPDFFRRKTPPAGMHGYYHVHTEEGLPFLAAERDFASHLPVDRPASHVDVWAAMRARLGLQDRREKGPPVSEAPCTF